MLQDLRFGLKLLWKEKAFTFAALLTLALCIGANTAIFTFLKSVIIEPLPLPDSSRLVTMFNVYPGVGVNDRGANGVPDYLDRRQLKDLFESVALTGERGYDIGGQGSAVRIDGSYVTPSYFHVLRVPPMMGRAFIDEDAIQGKDKSAILSYGQWKSLYNRDPGILGKDIRLSGVPYRIVGVMPESFSSFDPTTQVWVPFAFSKDQISDDARHSNNWGMIARLQPGVSLQTAQQRLDALNKANLERYPKYRELLIQARFGTRILFLKEELVRDVRPLLYLLQAAVGFVLLIGCVNVANLMLVRANVRMKELAIRFSLGADRWRLGRQLITESVLLSILGGLLGLLVGFGGVRALTVLAAKDLPHGVTIHIDATVLWFSAAIAILTGVAFGIAPVFHLVRRDLNEVFRQNSRTGTSERGALWTRAALVTAQVALAFVLLAGASLLTLSFSKLLTVNPGFRPDNVLTAQFSLPSVRYQKDPQVLTFLKRLIDSTRSIPGVASVGATDVLPFSGSGNANAMFIEGRASKSGELPPVPCWNNVDPGYLQTMQVPLLRGRALSESDGPDSPKVAVIDEYLAKKYWPNGNPIGAKLRRGVEPTSALTTIVGVVASVKLGDLAEKNPIGQVYFPYTQFVPRSMHLVVRANRDDAQLTSAIRQRLLAADPELALFDVKTMPQRLSASVGRRRAVMMICLVFAGLALLLSAVGIYGVLAYSVAQRTRELGIRVALGAGMRDVLSIVLGQGLKLAALGLVIGIVGAMAVTRLMTSLLFDVAPTDPAMFAIGAAILLSVALAASAIPAWRAMRIHPATALRAE